LFYKHMSYLLQKKVMNSGVVTAKLLEIDSIKWAGIKSI